MSESGRLRHGDGGQGRGDRLRTLLHRVRRLKDRSALSAAGSLARLFRRGRRPVLAELYRRRQPCVVCKWCAEAETGYLLTLLPVVADPQFARAYAKADGIRVPHMLSALELGAGTPACLLDRTRAKWEELRKDLDRFVSKHDYRNREPFTEARVARMLRHPRR